MQAGRLVLNLRHWEHETLAPCSASRADVPTHEVVSQQTCNTHRCNMSSVQHEMVQRAARSHARMHARTPCNFARCSSQQLAPCTCSVQHAPCGQVVDLVLYYDRKPTDLPSDVRKLLDDQLAQMRPILER